MTAPKVGLITFGDERPHEWNNLFRALTEPRHQAAREFFASLPIELHAAQQVARTKDEIDGQIDDLQRAGVEAFIAHVPCWTAPNLVVRGVQRLGLPTALLSNKSPATHGTVGLLGAAGALAQIGFPHLRIREDFDSGRLEHQVLPFLHAAHAVRQLRGEVFGMFGGRSLGIDTGTFDPMQWRALFGVDVEHIDQLEIIRRADQMAEAQSEEMMAWLARNVRSIGYNDQGLTPAKLSYQVRCYLATKQIVEEKGLDFAAIKCMPDLATHFVPQCISAAFMPAPFDAAGDKEPFAFACEADGDGALTMEVLKHVTGGQPVFFADLSYLNEETHKLYLPNCGAFCAWYAARADSPADNLKQMELRPAMRAGGGAITYFKAAAGPVTLARLYRRKSQYYMAIIPGEAEAPSEKEYADFVAARGRHQLPTAFVRVKADFEQIIQEFGANHISGVTGSCTDELLHVCRLLGIKPVVFDDQAAAGSEGG